MSRNISDAGLDLLVDMLPPECYFVLIVHTRDGGSIDTNIPKEKLVELLRETIEEIESGNAIQKGQAK